MDQFEYSDIILDDEGNELNPEELDWDLGYTYPDKKLIEHVPATEGRPTERHYEVNWIQLDDGEKIEIEDSYNSPWIKMLDDKNGVVDFTPQDDRNIVAIDFKEIIDDPGEPAKAAYDKYLEFSRWAWYTEEELQLREEEKAQREEEERLQEERIEFLATGPNRLSVAETKIDNVMENLSSTDIKLDNTESRLTDTEVNVEDLTLLMAEMIGV